MTLLIPLAACATAFFTSYIIPMPSSHDQAKPYVVKRGADRVYTAVEETSGKASLLVYDLGKNFLGSVELGTGKPVDMELTGDWSYVIIGESLVVVDMRDTASMVVKEVTAAGSLLLEKNKLYITHGGRTMAVYDVSVRDSPVLLSSVTMPGNVAGELHNLAKAKDGHGLYAACGQVPVCHFDLSATPPTVSTHTYTPNPSYAFTTIAHRGTLIYVGDENGIMRVYSVAGDVAPPPHFSSQIQNSGLRPRYMSMVHDTLYVANAPPGGPDPHSRFQAYSLEFPTIPTLQPHFMAPFPVSMSVFSVYEGTAYIAGAAGGMLWLGGVASSTPAVVSWGCYKDTLADRVFKFKYGGDRMTAEFCMATCEEDGYTMAGLQYAKECWCGDRADLDGVQKYPIERCDKPCAGNAGDLCGGSFAMEVQSRVEMYTKPAPEYVGCYVDQMPRLFPFLAYFGDNNTPTKCTALCFDNGYTHAGLEYGRECFCGNLASGSTPVSESDCNKPCTGDSSKTCGGGWRMSVWNTKLANSF